jgi:hypothetical protein
MKRWVSTSSKIYLFEKLDVKLCNNEIMYTAFLSATLQAEGEVEEAHTIARSLSFDITENEIHHQKKQYENCRANEEFGG